MSTHILSSDSQAIVLLCGRFGDRGSFKPLTVVEYSQLAQLLLNQNFRPADLLQPENIVQLTGLERINLTQSRLQSLLNRSGSLAFAIEHWTNKGLWIITRSDPQYPKRLKNKLKHLAPPVLYGTGNRSLLSNHGLGFVGSRNVDEAGLNFTNEVAKMCVSENTQVISGGAKGVDSAAMVTALNEGGRGVGVLGHGLAKASLSKKYRQSLQDGNLVLISPFYPETGFSVGTAMARNKYIYILSDACLVVSSDLKGGTWTGANENLKNRWVPLLVRQDSTVPPGNTQLIKQGGMPVNLTDFTTPKNFQEWLCNLPRSLEPLPVATQSELFTATNKTAIDKASLEAEPPIKAKTTLKATTPQSLASETNREVDDLFEIIWPYFERALVTPKKVDELATLFTLNKTQTKDWLNKAVEQGKVKKLSKPVRYQLADNAFLEEYSSQSS